MHTALISPRDVDVVPNDQLQQQLNGRLQVRIFFSGRERRQLIADAWPKGVAIRHTKLQRYARGMSPRTLSLSSLLMNTSFGIRAFSGSIDYC